MEQLVNFFERVIYSMTKNADGQQLFDPVFNVRLMLKDNRVTFEPTLEQACPHPPYPLACRAAAQCVAYLGTHMD